MRILIGYSMRSGSTLLQHILDGHSRIQAYGDLSSFRALFYAGRTRPGRWVCVKPMDLLYLQRVYDYARHFDRFLWISRDPRDSYLSSLESGYAYLFWPRGRLRHGVDTGLLARWRRIYRQYFEHPERWLLLRYEDLVTRPRPTLRRILKYLELPEEPLVPFPRFKRRHGGDYKIIAHRYVSSGSLGRYRGVLTAEALEVFDELLGEEMEPLGYARAECAAQEPAHRSARGRGG